MVGRRCLDTRLRGYDGPGFGEKVLTIQAGGRGRVFTNYPGLVELQPSRPMTNWETKIKDGEPLNHMRRTGSCCPVQDHKCRIQVGIIV